RHLRPPRRRRAPRPRLPRLPGQPTLAAPSTSRRRERLTLYPETSSSPSQPLRSVHLTEAAGGTTPGVLPAVEAGALVERPLLVGATAADPRNVVVVWNALRRWFDAHGVPFEYALFSTYDALCRALLDGTVDVAWNAPMAHAQS